MFNKICYLVLAILIPVDIMFTWYNVAEARKSDVMIDIIKVEPIKNEVIEKSDEIDESVVEFLSSPDITDSLIMRISAYSSVEGCDDKDCIMANGKKAELGFVACPRSWKLGTEIRIEGKEYVCGDRLSKKYDDRVDLFMGYGMEAYERARQWGVRSLEVELID
jgi:3D (Asp-Asp-Asp) domain-containing protein